MVNLASSCSGTRYGLSHVHDSVVGFDKTQIATSSKRPQEFIDREEQEVHRKSSVDPHAMRLAQAHRRFSVMEEHRRASVDPKGSFEEKEKEVELDHREEV